VTPAFLLPQSWILHVAGPIYRNYSPAEADARGWAAWPSPRFQRALTATRSKRPLALRTVRRYLQESPGTGLRRIVFAMFGASEFDVFTRQLEHLEAQPEPPC